MPKTFTEYLKSVNRKLIDVDGYYGAQCWDSMSHYMQWLGVPALKTYTWAGGNLPHNGYACNVYHHAKNAGLLTWFKQLKSTATPKPGDIAFWEKSLYWPGSHVAIVTKVTKTHIETMSQNDPTGSANHYVTYSRAGVLGYLRPKDLRKPYKHVIKRGQKTVANTRLTLFTKPTGNNISLHTGEGLLYGYWVTKTSVTLKGAPGTTGQLYLNRLVKKNGKWQKLRTLKTVKFKIGKTGKKTVNLWKNVKNPAGYRLRAYLKTTKPVDIVEATFTGDPK